MNSTPLRLLMRFFPIEHVIIYPWQSCERYFSLSTLGCCWSGFTKISSTNRVFSSLQPMSHVAEPERVWYDNTQISRAMGDGWKLGDFGSFPHSCRWLSRGFSLRNLGRITDFYLLFFLPLFSLNIGINDADDDWFLLCRVCLPACLPACCFGVLCFYDGLNE